MSEASEAGKGRLMIGHFKVTFYGERGKENLVK